MTHPAPPVVLITGATGGIGAATARAYAGRGARLVLLARSAHRLEALRADVAALGADALVTVADIADGDAVDAAFAAAAARFGRVDVVVHAAAVVAYGRFDEIPRDVWDRVAAVNVTGTSNVARAALRQFREQDPPQEGSLVLVGSVLSLATVPFMGSYVTTKWQNRALAHVLQQEARETPGVHVGIVHPGSVRTAIYSLAGNYAGRIGRPPPPVYRPETVARAILDLVDSGKRMRSVSVANPVIALGFHLVPRLYDVLVGPLMKVAGLSRREVAAHPGNVFAASEDVGLLPADGETVAAADRLP